MKQMIKILHEHDDQRIVTAEGRPSSRPSARRVTAFEVFKRVINIGKGLELHANIQPFTNDFRSVQLPKSTTAVVEKSAGQSEAG
ncbi:hypothetical protein EVAR_60073_1 [Eumeta japonica]|uniref:Uncharacterized protein n=1 Tax=Eumeta variegata TaxID=151549 RepID=A0A4C1ZGU0_EUMVA|nr:hypothetical protein EVAR_60073_1 [Eumeta japonica]